MKKLLSGSLVMILIMCQMACESEPKENYNSLHGKWELESATKNGKITELLTGLFFDFAEDGSMRTNVTGTPESVNYAVVEGVIQQREGRIDLDYQIRTLNDTLLVLSSKIRNSSFVFNLTRAIEEEVE